MEWTRDAIADVDAIILPPFAGGFLTSTNATGHPQLVWRAGFDDATTPRSISLIGQPFDEATLVRVGMALEARLAVAERRPKTPWFQGG
jgi:Asp-tRNA(Asn)/Glu-tRNA(Gln) amidotransferase A subunit family amidase